MICLFPVKKRTQRMWLFFLLQIRFTVIYFMVCVPWYILYTRVCCPAELMHHRYLFTSHTHIPLFSFVSVLLPYILSLLFLSLHHHLPHSHLFLFHQLSLSSFLPFHLVLVFNQSSLLTLAFSLHPPVSPHALRDKNCSISP